MAYSIVIPTYNRAHSLRRCIDSVLQQTYDLNEVIIIDDYSTDDTRNIVEEYRNKYTGIITYATNQRQKGANGARNTGILLSKNEWIFFLDSDDTWHENKIKAYHDIILRNGDQFSLFFDDINTAFPPNEQENGRKYLKILPLRNIIGGFSKICINKKVMEKIGLLDESLLSRQDLDMYIRVAEGHGIFHIQQQLSNIDTGGNDRISDNHSKKAKGYEQIIDKHRKYYNNNTLSLIYVKAMIRHLKSHSWRDAFSAGIKLLQYTFKGGNGIFIYLLKKGKTTVKLK